MHAPVKILYFIEQNDTSRYYAKLFEHLKKLSTFQFHVLNLTICPDFDLAIKNKVASCQSIMTKKYYFSIFEIIRHIRRLRPDIIHAHEFIPAFYMSLAMILSFSSAKLIYHRHHNHTRGFRNILFDWLAGLKAIRIVTVSKNMAELATMEQPQFKNKITYIYNGIDLAHQTIKNNELALPEKKIKILLLGRFRDVKGHSLAIDAFIKLKEKYNDIGLYFAGTGSTETEIKKKVADLDLTNDIFFLGHVYNIADLIDKMTMCIVPSKIESFGLVAIEGMAGKKLVIASKVGGLKEIIQHGDTGILIPSGDIDKLYQMMDYYIENKNEREQIAERGYNRYLNNYTSEVMAKSYLELYNSI
ncbi:MAG: glycosyltransferase family 4 protein [Bacteriovoracaceae bacterium]|nr:glycosyltransferase family 4 protein [Bacteriovoracaceae bacterium]